MTGMRLIIIGPPGSGKGTISQLFEKDLDFTHFSVGEILREHVQNNDELGHIAQEFINKGELIPDNITINIITTYLRSLEDEKVIIDGFPRNVFQAAFLVENFPIQGIVRVELDDETIIKRLSGRRVCPVCSTSYHITNNPPKHEGVCDNDGHALELRKDDNPEVVKKRLQEYHESQQKLDDIFKTESVPEISLRGDIDIHNKKSILEEINDWLDTLQK